MRYSKKQWSVLLGAILLMMAFALVHTSVGYFVTPVTESLGIPRSAYTFYYTILQLVSILVIPQFSRLITRIGSRRLLLPCAFWGALGFVGFGLSRSTWMFYLAGAWLGLIVTGCTSLMSAVIIQDCFGEKSGTPMGLTMAGTGVCGILQGILLPGLLESIGWQNTYFLMGACWAGLLILAALLAGGTAEHDRQVEKENRASGTAVPWTGTLFLFLLVILTFSFQGSFLHHMQAHFTQQGVPAVVVGLFMSVFNVFVITFKISQGFLFDRLGAVPTTTMAFVAFGAGLLVALFTSPVLLFVSLVLLAFGMSAETVLTPLLTRNIFGAQSYAVVYGRVSMVYNIGTAFSSPLWGMFYDNAGSYLPGLKIMPLGLLLDLLLLVWLMRCKHSCEAID